MCLEEQFSLVLIFGIWDNPALWQWGLVREAIIVKHCTVNPPWIRTHTPMSKPPLGHNTPKLCVCISVISTDEKNIFKRISFSFDGTHLLRKAQYFSCRYGKMNMIRTEKQSGPSCDGGFLRNIHKNDQIKTHSMLERWQSSFDYKQARSPTKTVERSTHVQNLHGLLNRSYKPQVEKYCYYLKAVDTIGNYSK